MTLAAPLLLWCIWAAVAGRYVTLAVLAVLAAMTKEQVGLSLAILGLWMIFSLGRRWAGAILAAGSLAWTAIAVVVIIPHYNTGGGSAFVADRYGDLGDGAGGVLKTLVTQPVGRGRRGRNRRIGGSTCWRCCCRSWRSRSFAPLLAAGALPDLVLNLLSSRPEQHHIEYHYSAVIAPFLLAAAIRGLATLEDASAPAGWPASSRRRAGRGRAGRTAGSPATCWVRCRSGNTCPAGRRSAPSSSASPPVPRCCVKPWPWSRTARRSPPATASRDTCPIAARSWCSRRSPTQRSSWSISAARRRRRRRSGRPCGCGRRLRARPDFRLLSDRNGVLVFRRVGSAG